MAALIQILKLLYPFIQEFGLKEVNLKKFISENKSLSYLLGINILLFILFLYALEQAHLRLLTNKELLQESVVLASTIRSKEDAIEQLELVCMGAADESTTNESDLSVDEALGRLTGQENEK